MLSGIVLARPRTGPLRVLWNHRWEYDKNPDEFFKNPQHERTRLFLSQILK